MVTRNRQAQARVARQGKDVLHRPLAKAAFPHDQGAMMVLQGARNDFGGRSRPGIDQHNDRRAAGYVTGNGAFRPPAVHIARVAAPFGHNLTLRQKRIGHGHGLIQDTAGVGPHVNDITQRIAAERLLYASDCGNNVIPGLFGKARDEDNANAVFHFPLHGF